MTLKKSQKKAQRDITGLLADIIQHLPVVEGTGTVGVRPESLKRKEIFILPSCFFLRITACVGPESASSTTCNNYTIQLA